MNHLLHPELFDLVPFTGHLAADRLGEYVTSVAATELPAQNVTLTVRTLNEEAQLEALFEDVDKQDYGGELEVVVVDNESSDRTAEVARSHGAAVVVLPREDFTYPRSMNLAMEAASHDAVLLTVGHARFSNDQTLRAAGRHLVSAGGEAAGVFGHFFPDSNASYHERLLASTFFEFLKLKEIDKARMEFLFGLGSVGVLGAVGAIIDKPVWEKLGKFDERYASGGEDTAMARKMLDNGYKVIDDPILTMYHTHGLGLFFNGLKQMVHWVRTVRGPQDLDMHSLSKRRPDIDFS